MPPSGTHSAFRPDRPVAIVLCSVLTGLATVRALASQGIRVHALVFDRKDPLKLSTAPERVVQLNSAMSEPDLVHYLHGYAQALGGYPVLFATSDAHALMLSKHADRLAQVSRSWSTSHDTLCSIVYKERLYRLAEAGSIPLPPWTSAHDLIQVETWCKTASGPYLLKPSYAGTRDAVLTEKNRVFQDADALLAYLRSIDRSALLVQKLMAGGDGEIYDTYGLCQEDGTILSISTHRRWRQHPPNLGTTTFGEIPAHAGHGDMIMIEQTQKLLGQLRYHGIFGIEWLHDRQTGQFLLIDFNARPFSSIGHLCACGVNLPMLGYRNLVGEDLSGESLFPNLRHLFWLDLLRDCQSRHCRAQALGTQAEIPSLGGVRSFAYWDWRDPGPALQKVGELLWFAILQVKKQVRSRWTQQAQSIWATWTAPAPPGKGRRD